MRAILLKNASHVVTMVPEASGNPSGVLSDQDVLIDATGRIAAIGHKLNAPGAEVVDVSGRFLIPGFVNAHDHLWQTMIAGVGCNRDLMDWLPMMKGVAHRMGEQASHASVALAATRLLNMGITTVLDWSHAPTPEFLRGNIRALKESGLRWTMAYAGPCPEILPERHAWDANREHYQVAGMPSLAPQAAVASKSRLALQLGTSFNVHWLENKAQRDESQTAALAKLTPTNTRLVLNHAVHVTQEDLDALQPRTLFVAHCPSSNMRLASGIINFDLLERNDVVIGLGLDGGTNDCGDMFDTMRNAIGLQRIRACEADVSPGTADALRMATLDGAKVMGLDADVGSLQVGKMADIVVLNPHLLNTAYLAPVIDAIVYGMTASNVEHVLVGGTFRKRNFSVVGVDTEIQGRQLQRAAKGLRELGTNETACRVAQTGVVTRQRARVH